MLQSCSSSPPHTSLLRSQSFSKDSYLKESRPQEDRLHFIESTYFQRGKLFISSMCVLSFIFIFIFHYISSLCRLFISWYYMSLKMLITSRLSFFLNSYNLDASRRLPPGTSFFILLSNKQILIPVPEILVWVRSGGYMLYTVVTGLYAFLVYVQRPFIYNPFH